MNITIEEGSPEHKALNELLKVYPEYKAKPEELVKKAIRVMYIGEIHNNWTDPFSEGFIDLPPEYSKVFNDNIEDILG